MFIKHKIAFKIKIYLNSYYANSFTLYMSISLIFQFNAYHANVNYLKQESAKPY